MSKHEIFTVTEAFGIHNGMEGEVGTTPRNGKGHDRHSKTYLRLTDTASTQWKLRVQNHSCDEPIEFDGFHQFELILEGDSELQVIIEILEHYLHVLRAQLGVAFLRGDPERKLI